MKDFDVLSKEVSSPNYKAIYGILASRQPAALKGVADSAQEPMNLYPADIKSIQDSLWLEVKDGMAMDGQHSTMEEIGKGLVFNAEKLANQLKTRPEGMSADAFYNDFTGIGTGLDPGVYNNAYIPVVVSPTEATAYYSNGGIAGTVIDKKSRGIFTNGYHFVGGLEEDELKELKDDADRLNFEESVVEWWRDGWIYGGSCLMPWLKGDNAMTHQMSVKELAAGGMLKKGCIQYFWTADRWNCVLIPNYNISARDYLTPEEFMIPLAGLSIKTERMAIGRPKKLPYWGTIRQMGWGISDFPSFMPSLLAYEIMIRSIPIISQQLSLVYLHQPIDIVLAQAGLNAVKDLMKKNQAALDQWNPLKAQALNLAGELKSIDRHWTDFDKLITLGKQDVGAKAQISHTVLFNEQTASLDEKAFDTTLKQAETIKLSANQASIQLQNIIPFLVWNKWGYDSPQGQKAREVKISFDSPTIQTNDEKIASVQAIGTALGQFTQAGLQLGDAMTLIRQFFPGMEIPKDMAERIQAFDDSEQDFQDDQREQTLELGAQKTDSSEGDDKGTGSSGSGAADADFVESEHKRDDEGKFSSFEKKDVFGNGSQIEYRDKERGLKFTQRNLSSGKEFWSTHKVENGSEIPLSEMNQYKSYEEAEKGIKAAKISSKAQTRTKKYEGIPNTWHAEERKVAKKLIDEGIGISQFVNSERSESKYIKLDNGDKIRLSSHDLPGSYEQAQHEFKYGIDDPDEFVKSVKSKLEKENAATNDSLPKSWINRILSFGRKK